MRIAGRNSLFIDDRHGICFFVLFSKNGSGTVFQLGGGATGAGQDDVFYENSRTVTANYTISTNKSAMSTGPITINDGITVTIPSGGRWVVL